MVEYEESRVQRIKENINRMKSLGILNLFKKLEPESKRQIAKSPFHIKKPARDDPPRHSTRYPLTMFSISTRDASDELLQKEYCKEGDFKETVEIHIEEDENPETYTEEQELGDYKVPWTLYL
ncbi:cell division cycle-associated protein 7-like [Forsythia ovata]|uniref:Cell division cycle-associated protein 7-like n=1 Tax=Forsythia ovata TaxID=205694 RepID=A0ABD1NX37_9LAMI